MHGSSSYSHDYYAQIVREGVLAANPLLFAEGVPNVGAAQVSLMLGLRAACQSIIGARTAGLDALRLGWLRISSGEVERVIVAGGEEAHFCVEKAYEDCGLRSTGRSSPPFTTESGFCSFPGAVSLVLESSDSARNRGAVPYAKIDQAIAASGEPSALPRTLATLLEQSPACPAVLSSANATWLDRAERAACSNVLPGALIGTGYHAFGELFSATPLANLAATLLTGQVPTVPPSPMREAIPDRFAVLCSDWTGCAVAAWFRPLQRALTRPSGALANNATSG